MIVRDEADNMPTCLKSVANVIDAVVISDTGSVDNTIEIIETWCKERKIPCLVTKDKWLEPCDYAHNRNIALKNAFDFWKGRWADQLAYVLLMDADCVLYTENLKTRKLSADRYFIDSKRGTTVYPIPFLLKMNIEKQWEWRLPVHEQPYEKGGWTSVGNKVPGYIDNGHHGYRSKQVGTFVKDAAALKNSISKYPTEAPRIYFYTANSLWDARQHKEAAEYYMLNCLSGGWSEEKYISRLKLYEIDKKISHLYEAIELSPERREAYYKLILHFNNKKLHQMSYLIGKKFLDVALDVLPAGNFLFINSAESTYLLTLQLGVACYYVAARSGKIATHKHFEELNEQTIKICKNLLKGKDQKGTEEQKAIEIAETNRVFYKNG